MHCLESRSHREAFSGCEVCAYSVGTMWSPLNTKLEKNPFTSYFSAVFIYQFDLFNH